MADNICLCKRLNLQFIELNMSIPEYQIDKLKHTEQFYKAEEEEAIYYTIHLDENLTIEAGKCWIPLWNKYGMKSQPFIINMHMYHGISVTLPD